MLSPPADSAGAEVSAAMASAGRARGGMDPQRSDRARCGGCAVQQLRNVHPRTVIDSGVDLRSPIVDGDNAGNIILAYYWQITGTGDEIRTATAGLGKPFAAPTTLETLAQGPTEVDVAVNASGVAAVVWADFTDASNSCGANCLSRMCSKRPWAT